VGICRRRDLAGDVGGAEGRGFRVCEELPQWDDAREPRETNMRLVGAWGSRPGSFEAQATGLKLAHPSSPAVFGALAP